METSHDNTDRLPASGFRLLGAALGGLLIAAASLKLYGLSVSAVPPVGILALPQVQTFAVLWELGLGIWLFSGLYRGPAWIISLATFVGFAAISGMLGLQGVASCGCFGTITASPWIVFTIDLVVICLLLLFRPTWDTSEFRTLLVPAGKLVGTACGLLGMLAVGSILSFGSVSAGLAKLRGDALDVKRYLDFGESEPGETRETRTEITNYSSKPIRLIGGTSDCSCITTTDMPLTIEPGSTLSFQIKFKVPGNSTVGRLTRTAEIWTDCDQHRTIKITLGVTLRPPT